MGSAERAVNAIGAVYPGALRARSSSGPHHDAVVTLDDAAEFLVRWLPTGWPRHVAEALHGEPRPDILAAPSMSPGARKAARDAGVAGSTSRAHLKFITATRSQGQSSPSTRKAHPRRRSTRGLAGDPPP